MSKEIQIFIPDIGGAANVDVIDVLVKVGDKISKDDSIITLESDKASMDIPSTESGIVKQILLNVGDKVSEGDPLLILKQEVAVEETSKIDNRPQEEQPSVVTDKAQNSAPKAIEVTIPDIGDARDVDVIDVLISTGDTIAKDDSLMTLEGDKATMDIPSPFSGTVKDVTIKVGDKVNKDDVICLLEITNGDDSVEPVKSFETSHKEENKPAVKQESSTINKAQNTRFTSFKGVYASPSIKRLAREFGVDLTQVNGSGRKGRIIEADVKQFVKSELSKPKDGLGIPTSPAVDFSQFGDISEQPLNKIKRLTAKYMHNAWLNIPHVTQFDEADTTELESFRQAQKKEALSKGVKLTPLAFIVKAIVSALKAFPQFNASLSPNGEALITKHYYHIGIAVDTPQGLVVPVIKNADQLSVLEIAKEMGYLSEKAREGKLTPKDLSGGSFTVSSLGGISGSGFTPIVNHPEVAILGVSRSKWMPVLSGSEFIPRLILPFSLSYDHRVIDGAEAARFTKYLAEALGDIRKLIL